MNPDTVTWQRVEHPHWQATLRGLMFQHSNETSSRYASMLLHEWDKTLPRFWQVVPKDYVKYLPVPLTVETVEALRA